MNAVEEPISAVTHIQNTLPAPPTEIAATTPTRFPIPVNRAEIVEALKTIALRGENPKKKFRIVVDYDPEFPFVAVDVFDLG